MAIKEEEIDKIRDKIHNLDLSNPNHKKIFDKALLRFISVHEINDTEAKKGKHLKVHDDGKDNDTIGYGFNMDPPEARGIWRKIIGCEVSFDDAKSGKISITEEQALKLLKDYRDVKLQELKNIYGADWYKLKPNEQLMIEDLYYNAGNKIVGKGKGFYNNVIDYIRTSDPKHWDTAISKVKNHGAIKEPKEVAKGIQNRRDAEARVGDSSKCPFRSKPCEKPIPDGKKLIPEIGQTIIPEKHRDQKENCIKSDRYYIWRSMHDEKVREEHMNNDGKIFDSQAPSGGKNPTQDFNCRCTADYYIPNYVEIREKHEKQLIRKYFQSFTEIENFIIKDAFRV